MMKNKIIEVTMDKDNISIEGNLYEVLNYTTINYNDRQNHFIIEDVKEIIDLFDIEIDNIVYISHLDINSEDFTDDCKNVVDEFDNERNVILTSAYISKKYYPEDKYYIPAYNEHEQDGREVLPVSRILDTYSDLLTDVVGFEDINDYIHYEFKRAFIYPNKVGKLILDAIRQELKGE